jgi:RHS repeat-associated protein
MVPRARAGHSGEPPMRHAFGRGTRLISLLTVAGMAAVALPAPPAFAAARKVTFYHPDHLGSTHAVTDAQGQLVSVTEYRPFGAVARATGPTRPAHGYTGQRADASTGLLFYNARYYDPTLGRFIQPDAIIQSNSDPQTLNRYSYVRNNPVKFSDPSGRIFGIDDILVGILIGAILGATVNTAVAAMTGGDLGRAALAGAVGGAITGGYGAIAGHMFAGYSVSAILGRTLTMAGAGALAGLASSSIGGGSLGSGAAIGAGVGAFTTVALTPPVFKTIRDAVAQISTPVYRSLEGIAASTAQLANHVSGGILEKAWIGFQNVWNYVPNRAFDAYATANNLRFIARKWGVNIYAGSDWTLQHARGFALGTNVALHESIVSTGTDAVTGMSLKQILSHELSHALMHQVLGPLSTPIYGLAQPLALVANLLNGGEITPGATGQWLHALTPFEHLLQSYPGRDL